MIRGDPQSKSCQPFEQTVSPCARSPRLSTPRITPERRVQTLVRAWQVVAEFARLPPLPALRHTAVTDAYRASRDLFLAQRLARHASPLTTIVYAHMSDKELLLGVRGLAC